MSFRARLLLGGLVLGLLPLGLFAFGVRRELQGRLAAERAAQARALADGLQRDLTRRGERIGSRLESLAGTMQGDNRLRLATVQGDASERGYLLDYAASRMGLTGLSVLQLQDSQGRILSSGHFRNEFGRLEPELPAALAALPGGSALARVRSPEGPFVALVKVDSLELGGRKLYLVGGTSVDGEFLAELAADRRLRLSLRYPGGEVQESGDATGSSRSPAAYGPSAAGGPIVASSPSAATPIARIPVPFVPTDSAYLLASRGPGVLEALSRRVDLWFLLGLLLASLAAIGLASWLSDRLSRPLVALASRARRLDLDRLDVDFGSDRRDEVGRLSRVLAEMTERLRRSARQLREAERAATIGEIARQVSHDIKNGLVPIRNVVEHLGELSRGAPDELPGVFRERRATLDSSIAYLQQLAATYGRLTPELGRGPCDGARVAEAVVRDLRRATDAVEGGGRLRLQLGPGAEPWLVHSDPVLLRRILENLVQNALDAVEGSEGSVTLRVEAGDGAPTSGGAAGEPESAAPGSIRFVVLDDGPGMTEEEIGRALEDHYTSKPGGTGLGLSIVRRLVRDLGGRLAVESRPGEGTSVTVELPAEGREGER